MYFEVITSKIVKRKHKSFACINDFKIKPGTVAEAVPGRQFCLIGGRANLSPILVQVRRERERSTLKRQNKVSSGSVKEPENKGREGFYQTIRTGEN